MVVRDGVGGGSTAVVLRLFVHGGGCVKDQTKRVTKIQTGEKKRRFGDIERTINRANAMNM